MSSSFVDVTADDPGSGGDSMPFARLLLRLEVAFECPGGRCLAFGLDEWERTELTEFVRRLGALLSPGVMGVEFCLLGRRVELVLVPLDWIASFERTGGDSARVGPGLLLLLAPLGI
jgi:hypothetical protein